MVQKVILYQEYLTFWRCSANSQSKRKTCEAASTSFEIRFPVSRRSYTKKWCRAERIKAQKLSSILKGSLVEQTTHLSILELYVRNRKYVLLSCFVYLSFLPIVHKHSKKGQIKLHYKSQILNLSQGKIAV